MKARVLFGFCAFVATHPLGGSVAVGARFIERLIQRLSRDKSRSYRGQLRFLGSNWIPAFAGMTGFLVLHAVFIYVKLNKPYEPEPKMARPKGELQQCRKNQLTRGFALNHNQPTAVLNHC